MMNNIRSYRKSLIIASIMAVFLILTACGKRMASVNINNAEQKVSSSSPKPLCKPLDFLDEKSSYLAQSAMIPVVMIDAIATEAPGMPRFYVSKNIPAMSGRCNLLEKGDSVVGTYERLENCEKKRLDISIIRIIRSDGLSIYDGGKPFGHITDVAGLRGFTGKMECRYGRSYMFLGHAIPGYVVLNKEIHFKKPKIIDSK